MDGSTENYSKLEYLGYNRIIITPDKAGMEPDDMGTFLETNRPAGLLIQDDREQNYKGYAEDYGISLYVNKDDGTFRKVYN